MHATSNIRLPLHLSLNLLRVGGIAQFHCSVGAGSSSASPSHCAGSYSNTSTTAAAAAAGAASCAVVVLECRRHSWVLLMRRSKVWFEGEVVHRSAEAL